MATAGRPLNTSRDSYVAPNKNIQNNLGNILFVCLFVYLEKNHIHSHTQRLYEHRAIVCAYVYDFSINKQTNKQTKYVSNASSRM